MKAIATTVVLLLCAGVVWADSCAAHNGLNNQDWLETFSDNTHHSNSTTHSMSNNALLACSYTGVNVCTTRLNLSSITTGSESGQVYQVLGGPGVHRYAATAGTTANINQYDAVVTASLLTGDITEECYTGDSACSTPYWTVYSPTVIVPTWQLGYSGNELWTEYQEYSGACPAVEYGPPTPILISRDGSSCKGELTDAEHGVDFRFFSETEISHISWTKPDSKCGWLAIKDERGYIRTGRELAGSMMPQHLAFYDKDWHANGFDGIAMYDIPKEWHGNGDAVLGPGDWLWDATVPDGTSKFVVWFDRNHNGFADPDELVRVSDLGISQIYLQHEKANEKDQYGNTAFYCGKIIQNGKDVKVCDWQLLERQIP